MDSYIKRKSQEISNSLRLSKILRYNLIKKDKNIFQYKEDDNNYIDYFFEIGVKPEIFNQKFLYETSINELNIKLKPEIISKFPDINKKSIIIDNNELINQVFPNGLNILEAKEKPDSIFFTIMSDNYLFNVTYRYKYFACLMIYESINDLIDTPTVPMVVAIYSQQKRKQKGSGQQYRRPPFKQLFHPCPPRPI